MLDMKLIITFGDVKRIDFLHTWHNAKKKPGKSEFLTLNLRSNS